jgi:hypothetical protein
MGGLPLLYANHLVSQFQPDEGMVYITFGETVPPPFVGDPEQIKEQVEALDALEITPLARLAVTPDKLRDFVRVLSDNLSKYDAVRALLAGQPENREDEADG